MRPTDLKRLKTRQKHVSRPYGGSRSSPLPFGVAAETHLRMDTPEYLPGRAPERVPQAFFPTKISHFTSSWPSSPSGGRQPSRPSSPSSPWLCDWLEDCRLCGLVLRLEPKWIRMLMITTVRMVSIQPVRFIVLAR